jgi:cobalt/nickel transport protein
MMKRRKKVTAIATILLVGILLASAVGMASAHFTMLFPGKDMDVTPEDYIAKEVGETKTIWILWGHPYEHILFDCPEELDVSVMDPDSVVTPLTPSEITVEGVKAYEVSFTVEKLGDYVVYARLNASEEHGLIDYTKAVIHCGEEAWIGWDAEVGQETEVIPFTRPYGLEEGFVFTGKALYDGNALSDADVEVEKYHTKVLGDKIVGEAEDMFSYDPPMMFTRVTKTNAAGEFAYTLDEPGIWFVGATKEIEGGLARRGVFIVPVLEAFPAKEIPEAAAPAGLEELKSRVKSLEDEVATLKTPAGEGAPGFGVIAAIAGLLIVVYIVKRRKK